MPVVTGGTQTITSQNGNYQIHTSVLKPDGQVIHTHQTGSTNNNKKPKPSQKNAEKTNEKSEKNDVKSEKTTEKVVKTTDKPVKTTSTEKVEKKD
jgi:hypothetical protein